MEGQIEWLEDGFFHRASTRLNRSSSLATPAFQTRNSELLGFKDTSKRGHNISHDRGCLDSLDDQRGNNQFSGPESEHQARSPRTIRDIFDPEAPLGFKGTEGCKILGFDPR